jgi:hypothetical protein
MCKISINRSIFDISKLDETIPGIIEFCDYVILRHPLDFARLWRFWLERCGSQVYPRL